MKYILTFLIVILSLSCSTFTPRYTAGSRVDINYLLDSIQTADGLNIPDTSRWVQTQLKTNEGVMKSYIFYRKIDKRQYIISITDSDTIYHYNYRVE